MDVGLATTQMVCDKKNHEFVDQVLFTERQTSLVLLKTTREVRWNPSDHLY